MNILIVYHHQKTQLILTHKFVFNLNNFFEVQIHHQIKYVYIYSIIYFNLIVQITTDDLPENLQKTYLNFVNDYRRDIERYHIPTC